MVSKVGFDAEDILLLPEVCSSNPKLAPRLKGGTFTDFLLMHNKPKSLTVF